MIRVSKRKIYDKGLGYVKIRNRHTASDDILAVALSRDGQSFAAATFDRVYYFSENRFQWKLHTDNFNSLSISECGRYLVIGTLTRLIYLDASHFKPEDAYMEKTKELPEEMKEKDHWILPLKDMDIALISSDGKSIVVGGEKTLYFFDSNGDRLWTFEMGDKIWGLNISRSGDYIAAGSGKEVYFFSNEGKLLWQFRTGNLVRFPHISEDEKKILASSSRKLYLFSQRGQLRWEVETGTTQAISASRDLEIIAGGASTEVFCLDRSGRKLWEDEGKDFINMVQVSDNGEGIFVAEGSEVLNHPALHVYYRDGTLLWSYLCRGQVKAIATDEYGRYTVAGIGRKILRFESNIILTKTSISVSERCSEMLKDLKSHSIDVSRQEKEFQEFNTILQQGKSDRALDRLLKLERELNRMRERYRMAKETIPNWLDSLGVNVEVTDDLINSIFPLYNKYVDINENQSLKSIKSELKSYISSLKKALRSVDPTILRKRKGSQKKPVLEKKLSILSTTLEAAKGLMKVVENLQTEKINFVFELEDTARNIIIDHLSGKNYENEINSAINSSEEFEEKQENLLYRIQRFMSTIRLWREQEEMSQPESIQVGIDFSTREREDGVDLIISVKNNYESPISRVSIRAFTSDPIYNFIEPDQGVSGPLASIQPEKSEEFWYKLRSRPSEEAIVNGILLFELDKKEHQVKLPPMNISVLSRDIESTTISESEYSRIMEENENYQETVVLREGELKQIIDYINERLKRFNIIRDKTASTTEGEAKIIWSAGKITGKDLILVTFVVRKKANGDVEIGSSAYSPDMKKAAAFVKDIMAYFRMTYRVKDTGA